MGETDLSRRMRELAAKRTDLPENWMTLADEFDAASNGVYADPQTVTPKQFLGCFARARMAWCKATGEALI